MNTSSGRRYARWHLWRDKLVYVIVFFIFIVWLEWTIHSHVFPLEVRSLVLSHCIGPGLSRLCSHCIG